MKEKERKSILPKQSGIYWIIFIIFCLAVAGFFYFQMMEPEDVWFEESGGLPMGVEIEEIGDRRYIDNKLDGYRLEITEDNSEINYKSGVLKVEESKISINNSKESYIPQYNISYLDYEGSAEDWVKSWIVEQDFSDEYFYEEIIVDGQTAYIITAPSYGDSDKTLVFKKDQKVLIVNYFDTDPIKIFRSINFN